jgi:putative transcriptional regulator
MPRARPAPRTPSPKRLDSSRAGWLRSAGETLGVLCAALVLAAAPPRPAWAADTDPTTAVLIVARSSLRDPNFKDSVVLVLNNLGPGPAGVILNRPTRIPVSELFPGVEHLARANDKLYFGGPLATTSVLFLFRAAAPPGEAIRVADGIYLGTDRDLLRKLLSRDKPMDGLRIFVGFSSWGPGQLEGEIARGDWTLAPATSNTILDRKSEHPWPEPSTPDGARGI